MMMMMYQFCPCVLFIIKNGHLNKYPEVLIRKSEVHPVDLAGTTRMALTRMVMKGQMAALRSRRS
jgi:hypothetical protein